MCFPQVSRLSRFIPKYLSSVLGVTQHSIVVVLAVFLDFSFHSVYFEIFIYAGVGAFRMASSILDRNHWIISMLDVGADPEKRLDMTSFVAHCQCNIHRLWLV